MTVEVKKPGMPLPKKLGIAGVLVCVAGIAFGWGILPGFIKNKVGQSKMLVPGTDGRKMWEKLPFPLVFKMNVFNITNPVEVNNGDTPMLDEIGPYYFDEWKEKAELLDDEKNDTVSFYMKKTWIFNKEMSSPLTGDEQVIVPHPALLGMILTTEREKPGFLALAAKAVQALFNGPEDVFLKTTVMDLLFNGNLINCTGKEFAVTAVCGMLRSKGSFPEVEKNVLKFSVFGEKNGTKEPGEYRVSRGSKDTKVIGQMVTYKGKSTQSVWLGMPCNSINGTDGTVFPPFITKEPMYIFSPDICRSMTLTFERNSFYKTIPGLRFTSNFGDMSENARDKCFCPKKDKCMKKGVMDLMSCQGAPLVASLPHFYDADEDYLKGVRGLKPEEEKHGIVLEMESLTGTPLVAKTRLQFSLPIHKINKINITDNLPDTLVPFLWIEEGIELSDVIINELKSKLFTVLKAIDIGKWVVTTAGAGMSLVGAGLHYFNPFGNKMIIPSI